MNKIKESRDTFISEIESIKDMINNITKPSGDSFAIFLGDYTSLIEEIEEVILAKREAFDKGKGDFFSTIPGVEKTKEIAARRESYVSNAFREKSKLTPSVVPACMLSALSSDVKDRVIDMGEYGALDGFNREDRGSKTLLLASFKDFSELLLSVEAIEVCKDKKNKELGSAFQKSNDLIALIKDKILSDYPPLPCNLRPTPGVSFEIGFPQIIKDITYAICEINELSKEEELKLSAITTLSNEAECRASYRNGLELRRKSAGGVPDDREIRPGEATALIGSLNAVIYSAEMNYNELLRKQKKQKGNVSIG